MSQAARRYPALRNVTRRIADPLNPRGIRVFARHAACLTEGVDVSTYRRRQPEKTLLYNVIRENLNTFLEFADRRAGGPLPRYVRQEFFRFLDCQILANGVARVHCPDCGYDTVVGFS